MKLMKLKVTSRKGFQGNVVTKLQKMLLYSFCFPLKMSSCATKLDTPVIFSHLFSIEMDLIYLTYKIPIDKWVILSIGSIVTVNIKPPVVVCKLHMPTYGHHCLICNLTYENPKFFTHVLCS